MLPVRSLEGYLLAKSLKLTVLNQTNLAERQAVMLDILLGYCILKEVSISCHIAKSLKLPIPYINTLHIHTYQKIYAYC